MFDTMTAREMELLLHRIDHPGEPVPPPHMDDAAATKAMRTQCTMHCVEDNHRACRGFVAPEIIGYAKPCQCTCHPTEDETDDGGEYITELFAEAAAEMYLLD